MNNSIEAILRGGQFKKLIETTMPVIRDQANLKRVEIEVLYFLSRFPEQNTMKDIRNHMQMNKGHISTVMDNLTKQGYIAQQKDDSDRRYVYYTLTENADEIVRQMTTVWEKMTERICKGVSEEDLRTFEKVAGLIGQNIDEMLKDKEWKNQN
ncbi:MAG: MarR family winged helix-turn-helix transcriptional regulator [Lachnospiraceae bacterium]